MIAQTLLTLRVQEGGEDSLVYTFRSVREAADMILFLQDFFPDARFVVEPARH